MKTILAILLLCSSAYADYCHVFINAIISRPIVDNTFALIPADVAGPLIKKLKENYGDLVIPPESSETVAISQTGKFYGMSSRVLNFQPRGSSKRYQLRLFGPVEKFNGQKVVNFQILDGVNPPSPVLHRMTMDQLWFLFGKGYGDSLKKRKGEIILMPTVKKGLKKSRSFDPWTFEELRGDKVVLRGNGKTKTFSLFEVFQHNILLSNEETAFINAFFRSNGQGQIISFDGGSNQMRGGVFIRVTILPDYTIPQHMDLLFESKESYIELKKLVDGRTPIYLTSGDKDFFGMNVPIYSNRWRQLNNTGYGSDETFMVFNRHSDRGTIAHEFMHYMDDLNGVLGDFLQYNWSVSRNLRVHELTKKQVEDAGRAVYLAIIEQRAFSAQMEVFERLSKEQSIFLKDGQYISSQQFYQGRMRLNQLTYIKKHYDPVMKVLGELPNGEYKDSLIKYMKKLMRDSPFLSFRSLFPELL